MELFKKYLKIRWGYVYILNIVIYALMIFIQYRFVEVDSYYETYVKPLYNVQKDYIKAIAEARFFELYNYLWIPIHVGGLVLLIATYVFLGYTVLNHSISFKKSMKAVLQSIVIFPLNSLLVTILKASHLISYTPTTIDDDYFFQSLGRLFLSANLPDIIYAIFEKFNLVELVFCVLLALILNQELAMKFKKTFLLTSIIYLFGTIISICFIYSFKFLTN